jgi:phenylpyruvate tautomerase PptA (4-oxalocrotonate tautomerase family)
MPTYHCTRIEGGLSAQQKSKIAGEITRIHADVTGAPTYFAQVIFDEVKPGNYFIGGAPTETKAPKKSAKKPREAAAGQKEMLMPIAGKKAAKETTAKKPASKQRKSA